MSSSFRRFSSMFSSAAVGLRQSTHSSTSARRMRAPLASATALGTLLALGILHGHSLHASTTEAATDLLVKFRTPPAAQRFGYSVQLRGAFAEKLTLSPTGGQWVHVKSAPGATLELSESSLKNDPNVLAVQPNYKIHLLENYQSHDPAVRARALNILKNTSEAELLARHLIEPSEGSSQKPAQKPDLLLASSGDNPNIPTTHSGGVGNDPLYNKQWGMKDMGVADGWKTSTGKGITVAVIDTGVDYTHEDLMDGLWHNPGEMGLDANGKDKSNNGVDDDGNGFVDDVIGWDFVSNDNKPYDLAAGTIQIILSGGNPGHGTHCAGNIGARANNGKGIGGVAPEAQIMALRFLDQKGQGDTAGAIKAIDYAVKMGAKVLSNSWGSEGDDPAEAAKNQALKDSIQNAQNAGVLFIAAAGNGHAGVGYDNDTDPKPGTPASYSNENIISVAAVDQNNRLGSFSNWGLKTVHLAAPGVAVFSTTVHGNYSDTVIDFLGIKATWDGTSMATPHVAGAAALYWAAHPQASWMDVKNALITSAIKIPALDGKVVSGGKLNITALMK